MSGAIAQMAASHPSQEYQVPGGPALLQPAGDSTDSVPLPLEGGRRRRGHKSRQHKKSAGRRHHKKTKKHTRRHRRR